MAKAMLMHGEFAFGNLIASWGFEEVPWSGPDGGFDAIYYRLEIDILRAEDHQLIDRKILPMLITNITVPGQDGAQMVDAGLAEEEVRRFIERL